MVMKDVTPLKHILYHIPKHVEDISGLKCNSITLLINNNVLKFKFTMFDLTFWWICCQQNKEIIIIKFDRKVFIFLLHFCI